MDSNKPRLECLRFHWERWNELNLKMQTCSTSSVYSRLDITCSVLRHVHPQTLVLKTSAIRILKHVTSWTYSSYGGWYNWPPKQRVWWGCWAEPPSRRHSLCRDTVVSILWQTFLNECNLVQSYASMTEVKTYHQHHRRHQHHHHHTTIIVIITTIIISITI